MGLRIRRTLVVTIGLCVLMTASACAQRKVAGVKDEPVAVAANPSIRSVAVADDGYKMEIILDQPATYTFYKINEPLKAVIDLAQTDISGVSKLLEVNKGLISKYEISQHALASGKLTRIEIHLKSDGEFNVKADSTDRSKLIATFIAKPSAENEKVVMSSPLVENSKQVSTESERPAIAPDSVAAVAPESVKTVAMEATSTDEIRKPVVAEGTVAAIVERKLQAIAITDDGIDITVDGQIENYNGFKLSKPERLVVDLFGIKSNLTSNVVKINAFNLNQARVGLTQDKLRIVFDSSTGEIPAYHLEKTDKGLKIIVEKNQNVVTEHEKPANEVVAKPEGSAAQLGSVDKSLQDAIPPSENRNEIQSVDFKIIDGYSQIAITAGKDCRPGKVVKTPTGLGLSFSGCKIPKSQQRYIDTSEFASVVMGITPVSVRVKKQHEARFGVKLRAEAPYRVKQIGSTTYWEVKNTEIPDEKSKNISNSQLKVVSGSTKVEQKELGELVLAKGQSATVRQNEVTKNYSGRKVTLEFSDADVRKIFQLIAEVSNLNFLIGDDVTGTISIKLVNVPWDQALEVILETKQLAMKREGTIVQIMQKGKMLSQEQEDRNAKDALELAMPLKTEILEVNYANITDIDKLFSSVKSKRGIISKDIRTNRIIVKDIEPRIEDMKFLLKSMDMPERQVMIEARIVEASSSFTRDLGVKWNTGYKDGSASFANINSIDSSFGGVVSSILPTTTTGGMATGMSFGKLASNVQLDMRLSAAATIGQVKVISTPKVLTLNNKKAKISQGQSVPYQSVSAEGTKTEFIEAVLTLEVTPHITADGNVGMEVKASNNSVGAGTPPPINKKEATTELVVKNGETTVIGGIYIDSDAETETGVPFLMDIPLLGWMFKSNSKTKNKTELLIFITPKVIN